MTTRTEPTGAERAALEAKRGLVRSSRLYAVENVELRADTTPDSTIVNFYGHASVTGKSYEMYGGPDKGGWTEIVDKGAFKRTLGRKPDVAFLLNHEGLTLARTKAGTLDLREDDTGLEAKARLDTRVSAVNDMVILMEAGNLDEMSFAFRVVDQVWLDRDGEEVPWWDLAGIERHIREVSIDKGDVSVVNYGANPFTDAGVRSLTDVMRELTSEQAATDPDEIRGAIEYLTTLLPPEQHDDNLELDLLRLERDRRQRAALL